MIRLNHVHRAMTPVRRPLLVAAIGLGTGSVVALSACGGDDRPESGASASSASPAPHVARADLEPSRPTRRARVALAVGRRVCRVERPSVLVAERLGAARRGASARERAFLRGVASVPLGGRRGAAVAARVYAMSLPAGQRRDGFAGCVFELEKRVGERPVSASGGRK